MLLSFSIDLSRSTETKTIIRNLSMGNESYRERLLEIYYKIFLKIETELYFQCLTADIQLAKLYLVKCIGDEVWFVYDLDTNDEKDHNLHIINRIIAILLRIASKQDRIYISEDGILWDSELWETTETTELILPRKCYIDLLSDYVSFTEKRIDPIIDTIMEGLRAQGHADPLAVFKDIIPEITTSLNLGVAEVTGKEIRFKNIRFDPIGRDVDLFFRCCNYATPALLKAGDNLFQYIARPVNETEFCIDFSTKEDPCEAYYNFIGVDIDNNELKGIDQNYFIYTILNFSTIPPLSVNRENVTEDGCNEARIHLLNNGFLYPPEIQDEWLVYAINEERWTTFTDYYSLAP